jgi:hypothetical protein
VSLSGTALSSQCQHSKQNRGNPKTPQNFQTQIEADAVHASLAATRPFLRPPGPFFCPPYLCEVHVPLVLVAHADGQPDGHVLGLLLAHRQVRHHALAPHHQPRPARSLAARHSSLRSCSTHARSKSAKGVESRQSSWGDSGETNEARTRSVLAAAHSSLRTLQSGGGHPRGSKYCNSSSPIERVTSCLPSFDWVQAAEGSGFCCPVSAASAASAWPASGQSQLHSIPKWWSLSALTDPRYFNRGEHTSSCPPCTNIRGPLSGWGCSPSLVAKSTKAVPLGRFVSLCFTRRHDVTVPNAANLRRASLTSTSRGRFRTNTVTGGGRSALSRALLADTTGAAGVSLGRGPADCESFLRAARWSSARTREGGGIPVLRQTWLLAGRKPLRRLPHLIE